MVIIFMDMKLTLPLQEVETEEDAGISGNFPEDRLAGGELVRCWG